MVEFSDIVDTISVGLKERGYKKNRLTWKKAGSELTVVFSIQKSQFGGDVWYYCFGIFLHALSNQSPVFSNCQIREQLDHIYRSTHMWNGSEIVNLVDRWENRYGSIQKVRRAAIEGTLPPYATREAVRYLRTVDLSQYL